MDPDRRATRSGCPFAVRGRRGEGLSALGLEGHRRTGIWWSEGGTERNAGRETGMCACAEERTWSSEGMSAGARKTGGAGWRKSVDGGKTMWKTEMRSGRCSGHNYHRWRCW